MKNILKKIVCFFLSLLKFLKEVIFVGKFSQKFQKSKVVLTFDSVSQELVDTGEVIDLEELIKSSLTSTFDKVLQSYLPEYCVSGGENSVADYQSSQSRLDRLQEDYMSFMDLKSSNNLPDDMSLTDVVSYFKGKLKKEGAPNETEKDVEKSE